jgi:aromatic-L-amino-acid decarboxylase
MMGLDSGWTGIMTDTASISSLLAIAAARQAIPGLEVRTQGLTGRSDIPRLRAYVSDQTHSSVEKGAITLGIGQENVIKIPSDADFRMSPAALEQTIEADLQAGFKPFFICGTVGTTSTTSVDPLPALAQIAARNNIWFHVDAAYGGAAAILPEKRAVLAGAEQADSLVINPHKWLFTQVHCSAFYIRKPEILKQAFSLVPAYLRSAEADAEQVRDYMDYGVQLGKRFRALKLWFVIRAYGRRGLEDRIREHIRLAAEFAAWVDQSPDFERLAPTPFSTICFRAHPTAIDDEQTLTALNESLLDAVNASGEVFLSATRLRGMYTLRLAIGNLRSDARHVARAWELLGEALRAQV